MEAVLTALPNGGSSTSNQKKEKKSYAELDGQMQGAKLSGAAVLARAS